MMNLISKAVTSISSLLKELQIKRVLPVILISFLILTANANLGFGNQATKKLDNIVHQEDSQRPKTTGEWQQEARETEGAPGERVQRIGKESAEALKDMGSVYPDTAQRSARALGDNQSDR